MRNATRLQAAKPLGGLAAVWGGPRRRRLWRRLPTLLAYIPVLGYTAALILPVYYVVISSFKTNQTIFADPMAPPTALSVENYMEAQRLVDLVGALGNSVIVTVGAELIVLVLSVLAAFAIARIPSRASTVVEHLFGLGFLIPTFAVLVPTYLLAVFVGLLHTRLFLALFYPATVLPLSVILLAQFMRTIPREIEESAMIDGASRLRILWHIILPLSVPGMVTITVLNFLAFWNEYIFALILTNEVSRTVQVALPFLKDPRIVNYALLSAGIVITLVPVYVVYAIFQRRTQQALLAGSVRG